MKDLKGFLPFVLALFAAGMWIGRLEQRVTTLENAQKYLHGTIEVPKE